YFYRGCKTTIQRPARRFGNRCSSEDRAERSWIRIYIAAGRIYHRSTQVGVARAGDPYGIDVAEVFGNRDSATNLSLNATLPLQCPRVPEVGIQVTRRDVREAPKVSVRPRRLERRQIS